MSNRTSLFKEIKKTTSSLIQSAKNEEPEVTGKEKRSRSEEKELKRSTRLRSANKEPENNSTFDLEENFFNTGRTVRGEGVKNKPARSIYVNKSNTIKALEPTELEDVYIVINELKRGQAILVKLDMIEPNVKKEILNHIYGACTYADFKIEEIGDQLIIIDPSFQG